MEGGLAGLAIAPVAEEGHRAGRRSAAAEEGEVGRIVAAVVRRGGRLLEGCRREHRLVEGENFHRALGLWIEVSLF